MSDSARKKQRVSPRLSEEGTNTNPSTLYADPVTPFRRAASAGVTPGSRPIRTPGTARTPRGGPATRPIPSRRAAPTTPHAIRALRERANATRTPGHVRRRSGRVQRETPRDILRDLSRVLARDTQPVEPSPQDPPRRSRHSALDLPDVEDGPDPAAPRLSMPLGDMYDDDDDSLHAPPRQSLLPNLPDDVDNGTVQSLEFGRRAASEDPRMMFGARVTERFGELNELVMDGEEYEIDGTFINRRRTLNLDDLLELPEDEEFDNTTTEIRALTGRRDGRPSDVNLGVFGEVEDETEEPTFRFTIPPRMQVPAQLEEDEEEETRNAVIERIVEDNEEDEAQAGAEIDLEDEMAPLAVDDGPTNFEITGWESEPELEDDADLQAYREEASAMDRSLQTQRNSSVAPILQKRAGRQRKAMNVSRFGHEYPSLPAATVKTLATVFAKSQGSKAKISKDTLAALVQTSDFFFEQMGEDLAAYAHHGGRRTIEESDVIALMKRTRQITSNSTAFSLAQKLLPRELLQQLRMDPLPKLRRQKRKRMDTIREDDEDD
ncbi:hypothetical protein K458DRAFT_314351 [Lentithecium fluviatile CBS 122367]|uniref:CENP-T/Histone H4 histone fold domain-containing protein n=1 Tax=Lentithecium fluviatile CBS 122367 TaxID=1168545 RepID=A0A6G1IMI1_9PLEO|nr:hypothetical protein K458DRAFT_314351 [Lentithecium fluviatile CBS 122367]